MYKKSPLARCFKLEEDKYIIGLGTTQKCIRNNEFQIVQKLLFFLNNERSMDEINMFMKNNDISNKIFNTLLESKMITNYSPIFNKKNSLIYKNQLYLETMFNDVGKILLRFKNTTFVIIGCGGIGNYFTYSILDFMPKKLILIDGDKVETNNLNRQFLFTLNDIGKYKCDVLSESLIVRNNEIDTYVIREYATEELLDNLLVNSKLNGEIIMIVSGDNENTVRSSCKIATKYQKVLLNIGYLNDISIIGPFYIPGISACPFCSNLGADIDNNINDNIHEINKSYNAPSSPINNAISSSMALLDILHYFNGDFNNINSLNKRLGIKNGNFEKLWIDIKKNKECSVCGKISK